MEADGIISELIDIMGTIRGGTCDYEAIPLQKIADELLRVGDEAGYGGENYRRIQIDLLKCVLQNGDPGHICSYFEQLVYLFANAEQLRSERALRAKWRDKLFRRTPQYLYLKNNERIRSIRGNRGPKERKVFSGKGVVYTIVIGGYDEVRVPACVNREWDYILYTDDKTLKSDFWTVRLIEADEKLDQTRLSRKYKILGYQFFQDYDYMIYIDGKVGIKGDIAKYIRDYAGQETMLCMNHYSNIDVYEEAELCLEMGKGDPEEVRRQVKEYRKEGFPEDSGLLETAFLVRETKDVELNKLMDDWWNECNKHSARDQISLPYCCWKNGFLYDTSPLFMEENPYIEIYRHA